ncbi:MAG: cation:proton antiporter [Clostridiales bacterium]|nr:cation:proton antiporter [Clostridiales bacterium]
MGLPTLGQTEIIRTFIALALLLGSAFLFGTLIEKIKGPRVVGEILGGMLIGGSGLFLIFPDFMNSIFSAYPEEGKVLNVFYQMGLIFLMFLSGFSTKIEVDRKNSKIITLVFFGATVLPMLGSIPFFNMFQEYFIGDRGNVFSYRLVFAIGVAITSIPVISKIFFDMGVMNTKFSNAVLTVSTFQDLLLWILLNMASRVADSGKLSLVDTIVVSVATIGMFVVVTILSKFMKDIKLKLPTNVFYTLSFVALLLVSGLLYMVGINIMYSAFLVGYIVKTLFGSAVEANERIKYLEHFVFSFFVPIYFALVGIQLNVFHNFSLLRFLLFFAIAFGLEFVGTWLFLIPGKVSNSTKLNFAITMNARGGPGIVLATVAYGSGIISIEFFTVLILTTMLSSMIAGYYLRFRQRRDKDVFNKLA